MSSIFHYDDIVYPHPAGFKGIRCVVSSPVKVRQKYFANTAYENATELQTHDAQVWLAEAESKAALEKNHWILSQPRNAKSELKTVRNITLQCNSARGYKYPSMVYQFRPSRSSAVLKTGCRIFRSRLEYQQAWIYMIDLKLESEMITPREKWRNYYLDKILEYDYVIAELKNKHPTLRLK